MIVAGYPRVSDDKKKTDGERRQDVDRQVQKIKSYCKTMNLSEPILFIDDGLSAYKDDYNSRPQFLRLLNEVKANRVQIIIIEDITRWSRRIEDGLKTLAEVTEKCKVISLAEGELGVVIPEQWFKTAIGLLMAEWASKIQSFKVKSGMERAKTKLCPYCKVHHAGRHPESCKCDKCLRVGQNLPMKVNQNEGASQG